MNVLFEKRDKIASSGSDSEISSLLRRLGTGILFFFILKKHNVDFDESYTNAMVCQPFVNFGDVILQYTVSA